MSLYEEDLSVFENSVFYVAKDNSEIVGSVKVTLWDRKTILPLEKLFGLNANNVFQNNSLNNIWHVGRFAISKSNGMLLLKKLLVMAISTICSETNSLMIAECDKKFVKVLNLLGIKTEVLAPSVFYLGSETLPIFSIYEWLYSFLNLAIPALPLADTISLLQTV
ncbi:MAG: hypothetical protein PW786_12885 [Arachidicoccus sp.]|nr:hypothetical protein [Arachidicoccus sp.]